MVICDRCKIKIAQLECEICNRMFCLDCDKIIHLNKPKNNHIRNEIQIYKQTEYKRNHPNPLNNLDQRTDKNNNLNSNSTFDNNSLYQANLEKNKSISIPLREIEKEHDFKLLSETYNQPSNNILEIERNKNFQSEQQNFNKTDIKRNTNINESEKEDEINNNANYDKDNNQPIQELNDLNDLYNNNYYILKNKNKTNNLNEKDEEIKRLQKAIEEQREIINNIKMENNNLEDIIEKTRLSKEELYKEKERLYNRKKKIEDFYSEKQKEIQKIHDLEKYKMIEDYENQIRDISDNFISRKSEYIKGIREIEDKMREYEKKREEEKQNMFDEIDKLKNEGINADKEAEYLIKSNDELNNKLRETSSNMDLLRATALMSTVPKMKSLLKSKKKKKGH